jgi:choline monooxygenase
VSYPAQNLLPPASYFDLAWYEREQRDLFGGAYNLVGYESDIPLAGDYLVGRIGFDPFIVIRREDGGLSALSSVCRHRGMVVVACDGHLDGRLRCPYHGWEYEPDGSLSVVPQRSRQFAGLDERSLRLPRMSVGSWAGMIFVHPDPAAAPLEEWLGDFVAPDSAGDFSWDELTDIARLRVPLACNWKLYIENHLDVLHLWYLHEASLGMYDHRQIRCWTAGPHWGCTEPLRPGRERIRRGLAPISAKGDAEAWQLRANLIFPNVPMTTSDTAVMTYQVVPTGPESCYLDLRVRGEKGSVLEADEDVLTVLRDEDGVVCEQMQAAMRSRHFAVGPMAREHEKWITRFQGDLLSFLEVPPAI